MCGHLAPLIPKKYPIKIILDVMQCTCIKFKNYAYSLINVNLKVSKDFMFANIIIQIILNFNFIYYLKKILPEEKTELDLVEKTCRSSVNLTRIWKTYFPMNDDRFHL